MKKCLLTDTHNCQRKQLVKCLHSKRWAHLWSALMCVAPFNISTYLDRFNLNSAEVLTTDMNKHS